MDKALIDINYIHKQKDKYIEFLNTKLDYQALIFLDKLSQIADVLIFSGVTRDFFLRKKSSIIRDLDIVIENKTEDFEDFLYQYNYSKNSLGGYKIKMNDFHIDIWELDNTWAIKNSKIQTSLFKRYSLPNTAFFNFSSIVYDYNNGNFIVTPDFLKFLNTKEIDLVLEENPLPELCIINSIYYKNKFDLEWSRHLKKYIVEHFPKYTEEDFFNIQIKHFKSERYKYSILKTYYQMIRDGL